VQSAQRQIQKDRANRDPQPELPSFQHRVILPLNTWRQTATTTFITLDTIPYD